jgi:hypothetical protein
MVLDVESVPAQQGLGLEPEGTDMLRHHHAVQDGFAGALMSLLSAA